MNIEISTTEYRDLLDILHLADAVMSGHRRDEDIRTARHRGLVQKLYALAKGEGLERLISYNDSMNKYGPSHEFEHNTLAHTLIDDFSDHLFWDQLIGRLSVRDGARVAGGAERFNAMSDSDRRRLQEVIRQRYVEEFAANGVSNLVVIKGVDGEAGMPVKTSD